MKPLAPMCGRGEGEEGLGVKDVTMRRHELAAAQIHGHRPSEVKHEGGGQVPSVDIPKRTRIEGGRVKGIRVAVVSQSRAMARETIPRTRQAARRNHSSCERVSPGSGRSPRSVGSRDTVSTATSARSGMPPAPS